RTVRNSRAKSMSSKPMPSCPLGRSSGVSSRFWAASPAIEAKRTTIKTMMLRIDAPNVSIGGGTKSFHEYPIRFQDREREYSNNRSHRDQHWITHFPAK